MDPIGSHHHHHRNDTTNETRILGSSRSGFSSLVSPATGAAGPMQSDSYSTVVPLMGVPTAANAGVPAGTSPSLLSFASQPPSPALQPSAQAALFSKQELVHSLANRVLHSRAYQALYVALGAMSLVCLLVSLSYKCPPAWFYILEIVIVASMMIEVAIRFFAFGKKFWQSSWNIIDIAMVFLCFFTFIVLNVGECGSIKSTEAVAEEILLIFRNGIQLFRLGVMMQKNRTGLNSRARNIDFDSVSGLEAQLMVPDIDRHDGMMTGGYDTETDDY